MFRRKGLSVVAERLSKVRLGKKSVEMASRL